MSETATDQDVFLSRQVMKVLDDWRLNGEEILTILALPSSVKVRNLGQYRQSRAFPDTPEVRERVKHIIGIVDALRTSYPTNPHMSLFWLTKKTKRFNNRQPLQVMVEDNLEGLIRIRKHLDCTYDWFGDKN